MYNIACTVQWSGSLQKRKQQWLVHLDCTLHNPECSGQDYVTYISYAMQWSGLWKVQQKVYCAAVSIYGSRMKYSGQFHLQRFPEQCVCISWGLVADIESVWLVLLVPLCFHRDLWGSLEGMAKLDKFINGTGTMQAAQVSEHSGAAGLIYSIPFLFICCARPRVLGKRPGASSPGAHFQKKSLISWKSGQSSDLDSLYLSHFFNNIIWPLIILLWQFLPVLQLVRKVLFLESGT